MFGAATRKIFTRHNRERLCRTLSQEPKRTLHEEVMHLEVFLLQKKQQLIQLNVTTVRQSFGEEKLPELETQYFQAAPSEGSFTCGHG